ncbi:hypothetical protein Pfo_011454 [Paulownia fortunei]|nr:hypothetical protein Pfo_011454 [Paulownia fortunei]
MSQTSEEILGIQLYKSLSGRRYMIIMDDMWSIEVWDKVKMFFPDNNNGSRIIVTTRLSNLANHFSSSSLEMKFLDEDNSWNLLCEKVFVQESCPLELEEVGKKIAKNCKGLPLSIVVTGGLLAKSNKALEYWKHVAEDVSSIVYLDDHEHCLKVLSLSYSQLPVHLKPCFLYMGVFPEDHEIRVSELTKLWIAEGFLKPIRAKNMEEIAEEFLKDLIERNLILVDKWGSSGKIKSCNIHDLLRDLCLREAQKEKFLCVMRVHSLDVPQGMNSPRRIVINQSTMEKKYCPQVLHALQSASLARSLICNFDQVLPPLTFRLLRVLNVIDKYSYKPKNEEDKYPLEVIFQLVNARYLAFKADWNLNSMFPSSICLLSNVQTLIVRGTWSTIAPSEIWDMPQLRHTKFDAVFLPDPPSGRKDWQDYLVLANLQTLMNIENFRFSEEVLKKIPNIRKLRITYDESYGGYEEWSHYCLDNIDRLQNLESLACFFLKYRPNRNVLLQNLAFPHSLKKLTLHGCGLFREDMTMIGSLPHLEVLKLKVGSFTGPEWNPVEGEFLRLKFLQIEWCKDLINWNADSTHFPHFEHLVLKLLQSLKEIPLDIGEIPTLISIQLEYCSNSAVISAKNILEEQENLGNVGLQVRVHFLEKTELESLASKNFQVQTWQELNLP